MDDVLTMQFERVERALSTLVDSIAAYNPSPQAAIDLVAADDELSQGLDQLARHQTNHARIQALRAEADTLEAQLKFSVEKLASLRHELFNTPTTIFPEDSRPIPFDHLLQYASNISKYTVPPTYRERVPEAATDKETEDADADSSGAPANGIDTPANVPEVPDPQRLAADGQKEEEATTAAAPDITAEEEEWLRKLKEGQYPWYPWPSMDKIRQGNLYRLHYWRGREANLDTFDIPGYMEEQRLKDLPDAEVPGDAQNEQQIPIPEPSQAQQLSAAPAMRRPQPQPALDIFDDMDED